VPARLGREGGDRAGQEQLSPGHGVGRVGAGYVESGGQAAGQRAAQVVLDKLCFNAGRRDLVTGPGQDLGIGVDHGEPLNAGLQAERRGEGRDGHRDQVIVAEHQNPAAGQRPGLVHPEHPPDLRADRAVRLVQLRLGPGSPGGRTLKNGGELRQRVGYREPAAAAARARRAQLRVPRREQLPALRGEPHGPGPVDHPALTQLVADRRDDGNRQLGRAADVPHGHRLAAGDGAQDIADPGPALGQPHGRGNLSDD